MFSSQIHVIDLYGSAVSPLYFIPHSLMQSVHVPLSHSPGCDDRCFLPQLEQLGLTVTVSAVNLVLTALATLSCFILHISLFIVCRGLEGSTWFHSLRLLLGHRSDCLLVYVQKSSTCLSSAMARPT